MKIVGQMRRDRGGEPGYQVRRLFGSWSAGCRLPQCIAGKRTADIDLLRSQLRESVIAIARHEVPFVSEVVIQAHDAEIRPLRQTDGAEIATRIHAVNAGSRERGIVRQGHILRPNVPYDRIQTNAARIAWTARALGRLVSYAPHGYRKRIDVIGDVKSGGVQIGRAHV